MYKGHTIGVVVPAYNEEGLVGDVIRSLPAFVDRTYAVDDASTDDTWAEIERAAEAVNEEPIGIQADGGPVGRPTVVPIRHETNRGVGGAIRTGYERALDDGMDVVAVVNGDGQMDPDILDRIVDPVVEGWADYAKGNRLSRREHFEAMSTWRFVGNTILTFLTKLVSGYWQLNDPQNGYTAISARALEAIDLDRLYDDYGFCNDLLVHLNVHDMRVADVEMESRYGDETSHIRYSRFIPALSWLLCQRALWRYKTKYVVADFHPLIFLYLLGALGVGLGVSLTAWALATGAGSIYALVSATLVLLSGTVVTLAMIFDRIENEDLQPRRNARVGRVEQ